MTDGEVLSLDAAVNLLAQPEEERKDESAQPQAEAEAPQPEAKEPEPETPEEPQAEAEEEPEAEAEPEPEEEPAPQIDPPRSWSKEDAAIWSQLPPEAQEVVARREAERDRATHLAIQEKAELTNVVTQIAQRYQQFAPQMQAQAQSEAEAFEARWGDVDWQTLADQRPEDYHRFSAMYDAEKKTLEQRQGQAKALAAEAERASQLARMRYLEEENAKLQQLSPQLAANAERRQEVAQFLFDNGFAPEVLQDMSATELWLAHHAMRSIEADRKVQKAVAAPRPATPAPKAVPVRGAGAPSKGRDLQGLETRLTKSGSLDDAVALLVARNAKRR